MTKHNLGPEPEQNRKIIGNSVNLIMCNTVQSKPSLLNNVGQTFAYYSTYLIKPGLTLSLLVLIATVVSLT